MNRGVRDMAGCLLVLLTTLLIACGGEDSSTAPGGSSSRTTAAGTDASVREELRHLRSALETANRERQELVMRVDVLSEIVGTESAEGNFDPRDETAEGDLEAEALLEEIATAKASDTTEEERPGLESPVFDVAALVSGGISADDAEDLRERWEQLALDRIYLDDQAARGGWRNKPRHYRQRQLLEQEVREEIGDEGWDRMLYASGQNNRVVVRDVLGGSAAETGGVRPGDTILRYDGREIFKLSELQRATSQGEVGERVWVDVLRDGEVSSLGLERGPLGTMLRPSRSLPEVW